MEPCLFGTLNFFIMKTVRTVMVFKTSVSQNGEIEKLKQDLDRLVNSNGRWNFDLEDCDNILRVETQALEPPQIIATLKSEGFYCEKL